MVHPQQSKVAISSETEDIWQLAEQKGLFQFFFLIKSFIKKNNLFSALQNRLQMYEKMVEL